MKRSKPSRGTNTLPRLAIVVPCYNEEEVLPETCRRMESLITSLTTEQKVSYNSAIYFVDDGSADQTWSLIEKFVANSRHVQGIKLSRSRGHQNALVAGLFSAEGDVIVSIDADLQDDIGAIRDMIDRFHDGAEIVYGIRYKRENDSFFKRMTANYFYQIMQALGAESVHNHADYRLMSRRAI